MSVRTDTTIVSIARFRTRCPYCGLLLLEGLSIHKLQRGWACYGCAQVTTEVSGSWASQDTSWAGPRTLVNAELRAHVPDRCDRPARRLSPSRTAG